MTDESTPTSEILANQPSLTGTEYGPEYFEAYGRLGPSAYNRENPQWLEFFGTVAAELVKRLNPRKALDVGCAKGFLVESLRDRGVEAYGYDISEYAIGEVRADIKPYCWVGSARDAIRENYDLITCIEVCEHISDSDAREALRQMTSHADCVLFSSTPNNFTEPTHVNVHPIIDWLRLFAQFSFAPDETFDAAFVAPQAVLFRRTQNLPSDQALCQFASEKNRAVASFELNSPDARALRGELEAIYNSKAWKIVSFCRRLRDRVKYPIARIIESRKNSGRDIRK